MMIKSRFFYPKITYVSERNGTVNLRAFATPNVIVLVSPSGQELVRQNPDILLLLKSYRADFEVLRDCEGIVRKAFKYGNEGILYEAKMLKGKNISLVLKEYHLPFQQILPSMPVGKQVAFLKETLTRAEHLKAFCQEYMPEYIDIPGHYGFLYLPGKGGNIRECVLIMQKVNGMTLENFFLGPRYDDGVNTFVVPDTLRDMARWDYEQEIQARLGYDVQQTDTRYASHPLASDLVERNVLIDFSQPKEHRPYMLWLIDQ
jgi:hypothetical protein